MHSISKTINPFSKTKSYRDKYDFETRSSQVHAVRSRYPDRIPIILEPYSGSWIRTSLPYLQHQRLLVPNDITFSQLIHIIRSKIKLPPDTVIFLFINQELISLSQSMFEVYKSHKSDCGLLFITYSEQETLG